LGIGSALYLGALKSEGHIFKRSVAMILFVYSLALFTGYLAGSSSMSKPLAFMQSTTTTALTQQKQSELAFEVVTSIEALDAVLEKNRGKKIMLDFAADWCTACKELDEVTFADASVQAKLQEYVLIRADVTKNGESEKALSKKYGVFGPPALLFFDENIEVISAKTIIGFIEPQAFVAHLNSL
jgi:thiol:disulfide interchange protein DsbD